MMKDRRRSIRLPVDLTVQWRLGWRHVMSRAHDININGLFVMTNEVVPVNHVLDMIVVLPGGPINFTVVSRFCGKAAWGHGIGAEIHLMDKRDQDIWLRYYRDRLGRAMRALPQSLVAHLSR